MKRLDRKWFTETGPITIWSKGSSELIPERTKRLITWVLPVYYLTMMGFGLGAALFSIPSFSGIESTFYDNVWGMIVAASAFVCFLTLVFRLRLETYSAIVLGATLSMLPVYLIYDLLRDVYNVDLREFGLVFGGLSYILLPAWRIIDVVLELRKARQRQLYAEHINLGEDTNAGATTINDADRSGS